MKHLTAQEIEIFHDSVLGSGLSGVRSGLTVQTIIGRIDSIIYYEDLDSLINVAALYAEVIAKGHIFNDGNKRTALSCTDGFLVINGYKIVSNENSLADQFVMLADTSYDRFQFSKWLIGRIEKL